MLAVLTTDQHTLSQSLLLADPIGAGALIPLEKNGTLHGGGGEVFGGKGRPAQGLLTAAQGLDRLRGRGGHHADGEPWAQLQGSLQLRKQFLAFALLELGGRSFTAKGAQPGRRWPLS